MRLFYQSKGFKTGVFVSAYTIDEETLEKSNIMIFNELYDGIYYLDIDVFEGIIVVFEDGEVVLSKVFRPKWWLKYNDRFLA